MTAMIPSLASDPETIYKYYTHGYETYNVFLNLVDAIILTVVIVLVSLILASKLGKATK